MHTIEIYSRKPMFRRRQYYWRCRFVRGGINHIVAVGGEGYNNLADLEKALQHFLKMGSAMKWKYIDIPNR